MKQRRSPAPLDPLDVLTHRELAAWLKLSERTLDRLKPPALELRTEGARFCDRRYLRRDVLAWLEQRRAAA